MCNRLKKRPSGGARGKWQEESGVRGKWQEESVVWELGGHKEPLLGLEQTESHAKAHLKLQTPHNCRHPTPLLPTAAAASRTTLFAPVVFSHIAHIRSGGNAPKLDSIHSFA